MYKALNLGSVSKTSQALSSPNLGVGLNPVLAAETFRKMNPVPGTTAPALSPHPTAPANTESPRSEHRRSLLIDPTSHIPAPTPVTTDRYVKAACRLDKAKATGPTGLGNAHISHHVHPG